MRRPADPGPRICAADRVTSSLALPSTQLVVLDHARQVALVGDVEEHGQAAVDEPDQYSCQIVRASKSNATGIDRMARARPRSATIRIGRRRSRSTQTPAGRLEQDGTAGTRSS